MSDSGQQTQTTCDSIYDIQLYQEDPREVQAMKYLMKAREQLAGEDATEYEITMRLKNLLIKSQQKEAEYDEICSPFTEEESKPTSKAVRKAAKPRTNAQVRSMTGRKCSVCPRIQSLKTHLLILADCDHQTCWNCIADMHDGRRISALTGCEICQFNYKLLERASGVAYLKRTPQSFTVSCQADPDQHPYRLKMLRKIISCVPIEGLIEYRDDPDQHPYNSKLLRHIISCDFIEELLENRA